MFASLMPPLRVPRFQLPGFVAAIGQRLPQWPHAVALTAGLNAMLKMKLLPQDSLDLFEGRSFLVCTYSCAWASLLSAFRMLSRVARVWHTLL